jgi:hypothetical protein
MSMPSAVRKAAVDLDDADDAVALLEEQLGRIRAHVAEALHDNAAATHRHAQVLQRVVADDRDAPARRLQPPARAAQLHRLARHHRLVTVWRMCME